MSATIDDFVGKLLAMRDQLVHGMRPTCLRCLRTQVDCYCGHIRRFESPVRFVILQHPKEFRNRLGTARMASLCMSNALLIAGELDERERKIAPIISDPSNRCVLLYPAVGALNLSQAISLDDERQWVVFVIDATWAMAKKMVSGSPLLSGLTKVAFNPSKPSGYRFRRQPKPECVSTIEAIHEVIDELDRSGRYSVSPKGAHSNLLEVFHWMALRQTAYTQSGGEIR